jgi:methylated-DNA-[protein]-cysteine S-methyltransferase
MIWQRCVHHTPLGELLVTARDGRVSAMAFADCAQRVERLLARHYGTPLVGVVGAPPDALRHRLDAYFAGDLRALDAIAIDPPGTDFQRTVWQVLRAVPAGTTMTYRDVARHLGAPNAVRAVGAAIGANPIWLAIPCHRIIGADGSLTGYAGGLERKRWLLAHEGVVPDRAHPSAPPALW